MVLQHNSPGRVLLVDDDPAFVEQAKNVLSELGELRVVDTETDAILTFSSWHPDLIILDALLVDGDTFRVLDEIRNTQAGNGIGILYLAKGRGAMTKFQRVGNELFGMLDRSTTTCLLREHVRQALNLAAA